MNVWVVIAAVFFLAWLQERKANGLTPNATPPTPLDTPIDAGGNPQPEAAYADFGKPMEYAPPITLSAAENIRTGAWKPLPGFGFEEINGMIVEKLLPGAKVWMGSPSLADLRVLPPGGVL